MRVVRPCSIPVVTVGSREHAGRCLTYMYRYPWKIILHSATLHVQEDSRRWNFPNISLTAHGSVEIFNGSIPSAAFRIYMATLRNILDSLYLHD